MSNPFEGLAEAYEALGVELTPEERAAAASHIAKQYFLMTGAPLFVSPNQMKRLRDAGVDCTHLLEMGTA